MLTTVHSAITGDVHTVETQATDSSPRDIPAQLEITGLGDLRDKSAGVLAHGQKQWLEIGMLLVQNASVLLLDEPVAGMSAEHIAIAEHLLDGDPDTALAILTTHIDSARAHVLTRAQQAIELTKLARAVRD
jgi:ABC-type uncharacterized transport system ATPase subunit